MARVLRATAKLKEAISKLEVLTHRNLMKIICSSTSLKQSYRQVKRNKGTAGIWSMPAVQFATWFQKHGEILVNELLQGTYQPQGVKQVDT